MRIDRMHNLPQRKWGGGQKVTYIKLLLIKYD